MTSATGPRTEPRPRPTAQPTPRLPLGSRRIPARPGPGRTLPVGFTLIEMILTVSIIVLMLGFLFLTVRTLSLESRLRADLQEISDLTRGTRFRAITDRLPWRIQFSEGQLASLPPHSERIASDTPVKVVRIDRAVELLLRTSPEEPWEPPTHQIWRFDPTGVVGPMQFRLSREGAYVEVEVDPLTGRFLETARYLK